MSIIFLQTQLDSLRNFVSDSVLTRLDLLANKINNLTTDNKYTFYIPLLAAFTGAFIAIMGQWFIKYIESNKEKKRLILDTKILLIELRSKLHFQLKDLAYFMQNTEYQFWQSITDPDLTLRPKCTDEHYKSAAKKWECESNIADTISKYIASIRKYYQLRRIKTVDTVNLNNILNFEFDHAFNYPDDGNDYHKNIQLDISKLRAAYFKIFEYFDAIELKLFT